MIRMVAPIRMMSGLDVSQPKMACPDTDGAALCHGDAEQISEHDDVDTIGTGGERFHSQHVDEVGDDDLRRAVRQLFAGGGQAYLHQVL